MDDIAGNRFPEGLLEWPGHRSGGVRRIFHRESGRPSGEVIMTGLLVRLGAWVSSLAGADFAGPRVILLVGGPGNGKTEAIEATIESADRDLALGGELLGFLRSRLSPSDSTPPRIVEVDLGALSRGRFDYRLAVVQDASVREGLAPAQLFLEEIAAARAAGPRYLYLACVNRGVLDDALTLAIDAGRETERRLLEEVVRSVALSPDAPRCWPLPSEPDVAVWPMDVESLLVEQVEGQSSPAQQLLDKATSAGMWPVEGSCPAGEKCPFCWSRSALAGDARRGAFLNLLRWYELGSAKRWNFRDLFSLISYVLAGIPQSEGKLPLTPCQWAAHLVAIGERQNLKPETVRAPFLLVASMYQHALFGRWPREVARVLRKDLEELKLLEEPTLAGLWHFLGMRPSPGFPATLAPLVREVCDALDPAIADPDAVVPLSAKTSKPYRDIDARFSQSVGEGLAFLRKYGCLAPLEVDLLKRLAQADDLISQSPARKRRPVAASRVQNILRDFACRVARRSLGARTAVVREADTYRSFQQVIDDDPALLHEAAKQVEVLLNGKDGFTVSLNTTFGEPLPPELRRATLTTERQKVKLAATDTAGRPRPVVRFLSVGSGSLGQSIPLTFELFRCVTELRQGMLPASLPRTVVALLDATKARLAGRIVRDTDALDGAEIQVGLRNEYIVQQMDKFIVRMGVVK